MEWFLAWPLLLVGLALLWGFGLHLYRLNKNTLGRGRRGRVRDARKAGLLTGAGLYLGHLQRWGFWRYQLRYAGDGHVLTVGRPGSGKGTTSVVPNLIRLRGRSLVVNDPKGELLRMTAHARKRAGDKLIFINPWGMEGLPNTRLNPLDRLVELAQAGRYGTEGWDVAAALCPPISGDNSWIPEDAQEWLELRMKYLAHDKPNECTLSGLWSFINQDLDNFEAACLEMEKSKTGGVAGRAGKLRGSMMAKSFETIRSEAGKGVRLYEPASVLGAATAVTDFDFGLLKQSTHTVYLLVPVDKIEGAARWLGLMTDTLISRVALAQGPLRTTFILDEFVNMSKIPAFTKALRVYRSLGVQLWVYVQSLHALRAVYGDVIGRDIQDSSSILQLFGVEDPQLIRDVETWGGGKQVEAPRTSGKGDAAPRRQSVFLSEDVRGLPSIVKLEGHPVFTPQRPPYWKLADCKREVRADTPFTDSDLLQLTDIP